MGEPEELAGVDSPPDLHKNPTPSERSVLTHCVQNSAGRKITRRYTLAFATYMSALVDGKASGEQLKEMVPLFDYCYRLGWNISRSYFLTILL